MRINENYFMLHKMILATLAAVCAVSAIAIESNADVRGWFEENWFGKAPLERPTDETFGETNVMFAVGRISIPLEVQLPERLPAPVIIQLCFGDEEPLPEATKQGFALVRWQMDSVARNPRKTKEPFNIALNPIFREYGPKERTDTSWGSVAAWAWGFRRVVDWVETRPELDSKRITVVGFSRAGKAALWAGAQDERIALTVSCQSGCGGAMALKAHAKGAETLERLGVNFPCWMAKRLYAMAGKEDELKYDAPDLLRLFAPREVLVLSANDAKWLGPEAEQAAAKEAGVLHWTRPGKHSMTADDWQEIFKVAKDTYIFAYFGNEREGMRLAASENGLKWRELNDGKPVLVPEVGKEKLLRDPSVVQGPDGTFHAVWTTSWRSPEIGYASSKDLIHWSEQRVIPVMADFPSAKNAWAPEITFDDESGEFYIYWASTLAEDVGKFEFGNGDWIHRIYMTTTKDFKTFTPTRLWFAPPFTVIDAAIVKTGNQWMMVVKNEDSKPHKEKNLRVTFSDSLAKGFPVEVSASINFCRESVEGPAPLVVGDEIFVYYDMYRDKRYGMVSSSDGGKTWRDRSKEISLPKGIRHGTAFKVAKQVLEIERERQDEN